MFFLSTDSSTTELYTLSLHDALPICRTSVWLPEGEVPRSRPDARRQLRAGAHRLDGLRGRLDAAHDRRPDHSRRGHPAAAARQRSEEHTSELQSHSNLVCRLLLEKKKKLAAPGGGVAAAASPRLERSAATRARTAAGRPPPRCRACSTLRTCINSMR